MFWFEILVPISLAILALFLIVSNEKNHDAVQIRRAVRNRSIEFVERQEDKSNVQGRLIELGNKSSRAYGEFRYSQLLFASALGLVPFFLLLLMLINLIQTLGLALFMSVLGFYLFDRNLTSRVNARRNLVEAEFPAIVEMLTLSIAAGDTPLNAFARISERSDAFFARELGKVVIDVRAGEPFHVALDAMGRQLKSPAIRRLVDALVMAMVRGAPIVDVLHRHVAEARINQRNLIMDKAGKAEMTMMIPIVFLILPISVLFALWPSMNQLSFFAG